jgi:hypothetical protein
MHSAVYKTLLIFRVDEEKKILHIKDPVQDFV